MIVRSTASVADIDCFSKATVKDGQCQIRLKNGEPVIRSIGKNDLEAIRNLRRLLDQLSEEASKKSDDPKA